MSERFNVILFCFFSTATVWHTNGYSDTHTLEDPNANPCGMGQYYLNKNVTTNGKEVYQRCKLCPRGRYNEGSGDVAECARCPGTNYHTRKEGAFSRDHCVHCAGWCFTKNPICYTEEEVCDGKKDCESGRDEMNCGVKDVTEPPPTSASVFQKYSWFFFIPVPFIICAGFGKLYHTKKNRGLPVNAETGSPIRIHYRPQGSGRSNRNRSRRSSHQVTIEMPLISGDEGNNLHGNHAQVTRSPSNQSQRTRSSQGSVSGQHLTVDDRSSRRSSATSERSRSGSHGSRSFSRSPRLSGDAGDNNRQRTAPRVAQPAVLVLPNQLPPRHVPLRSSSSLPPFPFPSPMNTLSHPPGSPPPDPPVLPPSGSPPPPSYDEVITSGNSYPPHSPTPCALPSYEAATRNILLSTSSA